MQMQLTLTFGSPSPEADTWQHGADRKACKRSKIAKHRVLENKWITGSSGGKGIPFCSEFWYESVKGLPRSVNPREKLIKNPIF